MPRFDGPADHRDELATDRDDASDLRDLASSRRDADADHRDVQASARDVEADDQAESLDRRLERIRHQIVDRLARIATLNIDETGWLDLSPAAFAQLQAHTAEQRRLAALDQAAIAGLLDDLIDEIRDGRTGRSALIKDRLAAAQDRRASQADREHSGQDRLASAQDRDQSAIEREQAEPPTTTPTHRVLPAAGTSSAGT